MFSLNRLPFLKYFFPLRGVQPFNGAMQGRTAHVNSKVKPETRSFWQQFIGKFFEKKEDSKTELNKRKFEQEYQAYLDTKHVRDEFKDLKQTTSSLDLSMRHEIDISAIVFNDKVKKNHGLSFYFPLAFKEMKDKKTDVIIYKNEGFIIKKVFAYGRPLFSRECVAYKRLSEYYSGGHPNLPTLLAHMEFKDGLYLAIKYTGDNQKMAKDFITSPSTKKEDILDILTQFIEIFRATQNASIHVYNGNLSPFVIKRDPQSNKPILTLFNLRYSHVRMPDTSTKDIREWKAEEGMGTHALISDLFNAIEKNGTLSNYEIKVLKNALFPIYPHIEHLKSESPTYLTELDKVADNLRELAENH